MRGFTTHLQAHDTVMEDMVLASINLTSEAIRVMESHFMALTDRIITFSIILMAIITSSSMAMYIDRGGIR